MASGKLIGAQLVDGTIINAGAILFSCGPWTEHGNFTLFQLQEFYRNQSFLTVVAILKVYLQMLFKPSHTSSPFANKPHIFFFLSWHSSLSST